MYEPPFVVVHCVECPLVGIDYFEIVPVVRLGSHVLFVVVFEQDLAEFAVDFAVAVFRPSVVVVVVVVVAAAADLTVHLVELGYLLYHSETHCLLAHFVDSELELELYLCVETADCTAHLAVAAEH